MINIDHLLSLDLTDPAAALEFRRGVAELAGWTSSFTNGYLLITDPQGHTWQGDVNNPLRLIPAYETSCDAALTLPLEEGAEFEIHVFASGHVAARVPITVSSRLREADPPYEEGEIVAATVTRAWLRYRRAQSAPVATADEEEHGPASH